MTAGIWQWCDQIAWQAQIGSTLAMAGLIWFVQIVHYPLMAWVGREGYTAYQQRHQTQTTWVVGPLMLVEALSALYLAGRPPQGTMPLFWLWGAVLALALWLSTALVQVPCHALLAREFTPDVHRRLVKTNWFRTVLWTVRGLMILAVLGDA